MKVVRYTSPAEVAEWQTASCSLVTTALRESKVLYENKQLAHNTPGSK